MTTRAEYAQLIIRVTREREPQHAWTDPDRLPAELVARMASALTVARCESGSDPTAINPREVGTSCRGPGSANPTGMFQIVPACHPLAGKSGPQTNQAYLDPYVNASAAYSITGGWRNWSKWACPSRPESGDPAIILLAAQDTPGDGSGWWGRALDNAGNLIESGAAGSLLDNAGNLIESGAAGSLLDNAGNLIGAGAAAAIDPLARIGDVFSFLTDRDNWRRLAYIVGGWLLALTGVSLIALDLLGPALADVASEAV